MVKPDSSIDYYSVLEVDINATNDEIKKQYHRLALLHHPDRNPDKEDCVAKFQTISAAYEILTDRSLRDKYDIDRKRNGAFPLSTTRSGQSGTRGNPYTATSAYPPPPRRTQAWTKPASAQTGADRFSSFPRPAPTSRKDSTQAKANVFSAWQKMNSSRQSDTSQAQKAQAQAQAAQARAQASFRPVPPRPTVDPNYPTASAEHNAKSSSTTRNTPSPFAAYSSTSPTGDRSSHASRPPSAGPPGGSSWSAHRPAFDATNDEQTSGAFGTRQPRSARRAQFPPDLPARAKPTNDVPYAEANRKRTPYGSVGGEKTSLSGETLRRTQSVRDTATNAFSPSKSHAQPSGRHHSVSPTKRVPGSSAEKPFVIYTSSESSDSEQNSASDHHDSEDDVEVTDSTRTGLNPEDEARPPADSKHDSGIDDTQKPTIFSMPIAPDTFQSNDARQKSSQASIDTSFSANDFSGTFTGSGSNNGFPAPAPRPSPPVRRVQDGTQKRPSRLRVSSHRATAAPRTSTPSTTAASSPEARPPFVQQPKSAPLMMSNFTPDLWKESAWDFTPATSRPSSRGEGNKDESGRTEQASLPHSSSTSKRNSITEIDFDDAMDVDPAPPLSTAASSLDVNRETRTYTVPLAQGQSSPKGERRRSSRTSHKLSAANSAGSSYVNLQGLEKTLDDAHGNGFEGMKDIASGLPFPSRASMQHPTKTFEPEQKTLPLIPKGPEVPSNLSLGSWKAYVMGFSHYLVAFNRFNEIMHSHFRHSLDHEAALVRTGTAVLEAIGQAGDVGLPSYLALQKEDERFRECWNIAHEKHSETMQAFVTVKEKVMKLQAGPGLSNA